MSERRITRRRGEAIHIDGPATIRVNRRVTLIIDAPRDARVERLDAPNEPRDTDRNTAALPLDTNRSAIDRRKPVSGTGESSRSTVPGPETRDRPLIEDRPRGGSRAF
jgi:hypothetical protein